MRKIGEFQPLSRSGKPESDPRGAPSTISDEDAWWLWEQLVEHFGGKLVRDFGPEPPQAWIEALGGLTRHHLAWGLRKLVQDGAEWPGSAGSFRRRCLPAAEELGLPSPHEAYRQAAARDWQYPEVYAAAVKVGTWDLANKPERETRRDFEKAYQQVVEFRGLGNPVEWPRSYDSRLPHMPTATETMTAEEAMASIRRQVGGGNAD